MERLPAPDLAEPVAEKTARRIQPRPEDVLDAYESEILHRAEAGELACECGQPLIGTKLILDGVYEGTVLYCPDVAGCGFIEY